MPQRDGGKATNDTAQTILGYDAYFGTYTVDDQQGIVTHKLERALFRGDIGRSIICHFTIAADVLTIRFATTWAMAGSSPGRSSGRV